MTETPPAHGRVVAWDAFAPAWWLPGPHLPTIWASTVRRPQAVPQIRERVELPDGDFLDLMWTADNGGPLVVVLHGLEGCHASAYARGTVTALAAAGFRAVFMHFRGCSGELNRLDRSYHSGDTGDFDHILNILAERSNAFPFAAIGYSLGGNVLLKWLGERRAAARLQTAIAISVPFDLGACASHLDRGFSRLYQRRLLASMKGKVRRKFARRAAPIDLRGIAALDNFWHFDDAVTAPLHGFRDVHHYYEHSSSRQYLKHITVTTLIVHARDDPFVPAHAIPAPDELAQAVTLLLSERGGHVGFVGGPWPGRGDYRLDRLIVERLRATR